MVKQLAALATLLAVLLVGATARTHVTTVEIDEDENQWSTRGRCSKQIQQQGQQLRHCQEFLREQASGRGSQYGPWEGSQYGPEDVQFGLLRGRNLCCNQLRQLDDQCRCEGLRQIVRRLQQQEQGQFGRQEQGQFGGQEVEQIARVARNLPQQCGVGPQYCEIRAISI